MKALIALEILVSLLAACGDDPTTGGADLCAAICEHDQACGDTCTPCELDQGRLRPEARAAVTECYQALTCGESDDHCFADAVSAPRAIDTQFEELCQDAVTSCGLSDDFCGISTLYQAQHVEAALACFDGSCDLAPCLDAAFGFFE